MDTIYVIDNVLKFNPATHTLHAIKTDKNITLAIPASLCFYLLIKNKGRIVTQAELLQNAWGERGMNVTPNTLHQNISLLRKSLNRLEVNGTLIQTIPKRGFMIADETSILIQQEVSSGETDSDTSQDTQALITVHNSHEEIAPASTPAPAPTNDNVKPVAMFAVLNTSLMNKKARWALAGIISLLIVLLHIDIDQHTTGDAPFTAYTLISAANNCKIYRNEDLRFDTFYLDFLKAHHITCSDGRVFYMTNHYPSSRTSVISCRYPIASNKKSYCISDYYLK